MKLVNILLAIVLGIFLTSCETTSGPVQADPDFTLLPGFDYRDKDMIRLRIGEIKYNGLEISEYDKQIMSDYLKNKLIEVKRFTILTGKGDLADMEEVDVSVMPHVDFMVRTTSGEHHHGAKAVLFVRFGRLQAGVEEDALDVKGTSARGKTYPRKSDAVKDGIAGKFGIVDAKEAFDEASKELIKVISKKYPLASKVTAIRNYENNITMAVDRGTTWGYNHDNLFQIYTVKDGMVSVIAVATGVVGRESSTLKITRWNLADEYVRDVLMPSILANGLEGHDLRAVQMIR